jgi:branched-subunit amino acid transport protein AzlD
MFSIKPRKFFIFKEMTHNEMVKLVNKELPISMSDMSLIDRVHERYPVFSKPQIAEIVMSFFYTLRGLLIKGKIISLLPLLSKTYLSFAPWNRKGGPSLMCTRILTNTYKFKHKIYAHAKTKGDKDV